MTRTPRSAIASQAWPILFGQLAAMGFGLLDTVMSGRASALDLAAVGLGGALYASVYISLLGVVTALGPIVGQHFGAGRHRDVGATYAQGLWLALGLSAIGFPMLAFAELWLPILQTTARISSAVAAYLRVLSFALPAMLLFRAIFVFNNAVSRPRAMMVVQMSGLLLKLLLNYMFVFAPFGLPALGALGCAYASLIVHWSLLLFAWWLTQSERSYQTFELGYAWPAWVLLKEQLRLGIPSGLSIALEATSFSLLSVLVARLGTTIIAGQQIIMNVAAVCYQVPLALSIATATVTAQAIGAGDLLRARRTALTGIRMALTIGAATALTIWWLREPIVHLYTKDSEVAAVALSLISYFALFHVFDALQSISGFVLRAHKIAVIPTLIYAITLWGLGLGGGYYVAFHRVFERPLGVQGLWLMQTVALFVTALLLLAAYFWLTRVPRTATAIRDPG
jgi:MATE family multidrug resistance protein